MDMAIELIGATEGGVVAASLGPPKTRKRNVMLLFSQRVVLALCNGVYLQAHWSRWMRRLGYCFCRSFLYNDACDD